MAFVHDRGRSGTQGTVHNIAVAGDPARIGSTPEDVRFFDIKDPLQGPVDADGIAPMAVDHPLGFSRGP